MRCSNAGIVWVLVALGAALAPPEGRANEMPPEAPLPATVTASTNELRDYPDIRSYWTQWSEEVRRDLAAARAAVAAQIEDARRLEGASAELVRLRQVDEELAATSAQLQRILRFENELRDLEASRERLDRAERAIAAREQALAREHEKPPAFTPGDVARQEEELAVISKTRDAVRQSLRDLPRRMQELRRERDRLRDEYLAIAPTAVDRLTPEGARREHLRLELAYLDGYLEYLPERIRVSERRAELLARDEKLGERRLGLMLSVLSGRWLKRRQIEERRAELTAALRRKEAQRDALRALGSPQAARAYVEAAVLDHEVWIQGAMRQELDARRRLEFELPRQRVRVEKYRAEAAAAAERDPDLLASDAERTRGFVNRRKAEIATHAHALAAFEEEARRRLESLRAALAAAESGKEAELAASIRDTMARLEAQRDATLAAERDVAKALQDLLGETTAILRVRERALAKARAKESLLHRMAPEITLGAIADALDLARTDLAELRQDLASGPLGRRPGRELLALAGAAAAALVIYVVVSRRIDAALGRLR